MQTPIKLSHLIQSTTILMVAFFLNKVLAIGRQIIIAPAFGTGNEFDAYTAAFRLPDILYMLISGGALATAFIPILSQRLSQPNEADHGGWRLVSAVANTMLLAGFSVSIIVMIFAESIVANFIASGFDTATQHLTADLMRLIMISTMIFSLSGLVSAVLNTHQHFVLPALAPIIYNGGIIIGALLFVPSMGVYGLVWGGILGACGHLLIQLPGLFLFLQAGHRLNYHLWFGWQDPDLRTVIKLMGPRILTIFVIQINFVVMFNLASQLGRGNVSALDYGWDLMQMPQTIIGTAIGIVLFPTMSTLAAQGNTTRLWGVTLQAMRVMLALAIPAMVGLITLGRLVIQLMFERGEFDANSTAMVYQALQFWAIALVAHCLMEVVNRFFYAQKDTTTPLISSVLSMFLNIMLAYLLYLPLGAGGLALSNGVAVSLEILFLLFIAQRKLAIPNVAILLKTLGQTMLTALIMGGVVISLVHITANLPLIVTISVSGFMGLLTYIAVGKVMGVEEIQWAFKLIRFGKIAKTIKL